MEARAGQSMWEALLSPLLEKPKPLACSVAKAILVGLICILAPDWLMGMVCGCSRVMVNLHVTSVDLHLLLV